MRRSLRNLRWVDNLLSWTLCQRCACKFVTEPFESVPNKGPPAWCPSHQQKEMEFSSEAKGSFIHRSKNGEAHTPALERMLSWQAVGGAVLLGYASAERAERSRAAQLRCSVSGLQCQVQCLCTRPAAAILNWVPCAEILHTARLAEVLAAILHYGLWSEEPGVRPLPPAPNERVKLGSTKRKKRLDFILLPRFYFCVPGMVRELYWGQCSKGSAFRIGRGLDCRSSWC